MPDSLLRELRGLCRRQNVTLFVTLLAAWAVLQHRYSGQDDILIATPFANRNRVEVKGLIGLFANNLVLHHNLAGDPSFAELLGRVRETVVEAFSHGELSLNELSKESHSNPQVAFFLRMLPYSLKLDGLQVEPMQIDYAGRVRRLRLFMYEGGNKGLRARLNYDPDLFKAAAAARMLGDLRTLLESVVADPEQRLSELPLPIRAGARPARSGGWQVRFGKRLRRTARRARRRLRQAGRRARNAAGRLRARIKNGLFLG
jgi:non-ribosomal peptide synthetase component F